ncbi:MAG: MipA/OmpV family protein [Massilia sp.]|nr:MipA/OmpV family protein [Massilia sp.]
MSVRTHLIAGALALAFTLPAVAQLAPAAPAAPALPDSPDSPVVPALPLWEAGLFGGAVSTPAYPGAAQRSSRALALPFFIYRGDVLRVDRSGIGARLVRTERIEFDVGLAASLPARSDAVAARAGMPDLGLLLEFGPRVKLLLANPSSNSRLRLELPLRAVMQVSGGLQRQGATFEPKLVFETREAQSGWSFEANLAMVVGDQTVNRYFYEVQPQYATPARPAYSARAGLMLVRAGVSASHKFNRDVSLFGFVRQESYAGAANRDSPLMKKTSGTSIGAGFAWTIGRSSSPARGAM